MAQIHFQDQISQQSLVITTEIFAALSPIDKIIARSLEKCGLVRIVDQIKGQVA